MRLGEYDVQAPMLLGGEMSEAEVLGAAVWLWMHSPTHRDIPLHALPTLLLPVIKRQQYVIASLKGTPVLYLSWMWMDQEAEARYLTQADIFTPDADWDCGDRMWIREMIAPFGGLISLRRLITGGLFPTFCFRSLWHRGDERGLCVNNFRGDNITPAQARQWRKAHPLAVPVRER